MTKDSTIYETYSYTVDVVELDDARCIEGFDYYTVYGTINKNTQVMEYCHPHLPQVIHMTQILQGALGGGRQAVAPNGEVIK